MNLKRSFARRVGYLVSDGIFKLVRDVKRTLDGYMAYVQKH